MAGGEIIGAAVGILMLIIVAYLVVGSTLSTAELVTNTQKEVTQQNEARLNTNIRILDSDVVSGKLYLNVTNTGNEIIGNFKNMDFYVTNPGMAPSYYSFSNTTTAITLSDGSPESIHLNLLDPGEVLRVQIEGTSAVAGSEVMVVTSNGVAGSASVI